MGNLGVLEVLRGFLFEVLILGLLGVLAVVLGVLILGILAGGGIFLGFWVCGEFGGICHFERSEKSILSY